jgi:hypothetical protein
MKNLYTIITLTLFVTANLQVHASAGADINQPDQSGNTPLHTAVENRNLSKIQTLIAAGAKLDVRNRHGRTPLDYAKREAMDHSFEVSNRKKMYEISRILESAGAPSSVMFEPMPTDAIMEEQHREKLQAMDEDFRYRMRLFLGIDRNDLE